MMSSQPSWPPALRLLVGQNRLNNFYNPNDPRVNLLAVALKGGKPGFGKIIELIDDDKKEYCESEINKTDDVKKGLEHDVSH